MISAEPGCGRYVIYESVLFLATGTGVKQPEYQLGVIK